MGKYHIKGTCLDGEDCIICDISYPSLYKGFLISDSEYDCSFSIDEYVSCDQFRKESFMVLECVRCGSIHIENKEKIISYSPNNKKYNRILSY